MDPVESEHEILTMKELCDATASPPVHDLQLAQAG